jgi:GTP:adenosylcobinamide-phosphate guanylyltransferase|tara:strand:+ start:89 stop:262 length:174 start_codon:yes stop_codon:yes gene_type:complete
LERGVFDLCGLLDEIATPLETNVLREVGEPTEILLNINTPEDLRVAEKLLSDKSQEH